VSRVGWSKRVNMVPNFFVLCRRGHLVPGRPLVLGRRPVLDGNSAVGVLAVPITLVCAQALENPVKSSVIPTTYPMF